MPLSPGDLLLKRKAIFMHESQKDEALFPGSDPREFWQRAEDRNKGHGRCYNRIGLPEFYAMEALRALERRANVKAHANCRIPKLSGTLFRH